jgi:hypothetical protein
VKPTPPILLDEFPKVTKPQPEQNQGRTHQPAPKQTFVYDEPAPQQQQQQQQDGYDPPPQQQQGVYPPQPKHQFVYDETLPEQTDYEDDYAPLPQQPNYLYDTYDPAELASLPQQHNEDDDAYQPAVFASLLKLEEGHDTYQPAELAVSRWGNPRARASKSAAVRTLVPAKDKNSEGQGNENKQKSDQQPAGSGEKPVVSADTSEPAKLERVQTQKAPKKAESLHKSQKTVTPLQQSPKQVELGYERPYGERCLGPGSGGLSGRTGDVPAASRVFVVSGDPRAGPWQLVFHATCLQCSGQHQAAKSSGCASRRFKCLRLCDTPAQHVRVQLSLS